MHFWSSLTIFFFFQAEDGIRDLTVTGVQTCALPISLPALPGRARLHGRRRRVAVPTQGARRPRDPRGRAEQRDGGLSRRRRRARAHAGVRRRVRAGRAGRRGGGADDHRLPRHGHRRDRRRVRRRGHRRPRQHRRLDGGQPDRRRRADVGRVLSAGDGDGHHVRRDGRDPRLPALGPPRRGGMIPSRFWALAGLVALAVVPWVLARHQLSLLTDLLIAGLFAMSLDLIMGYTGMVSFGHAAYFGLGAYASALLLLHFAQPVPVALLAGAVLAGAVAGPVGWFSARPTRIFFPVLTPAFPQVLFTVAYQWRDPTRGPDGIA